MNPQTTAALLADRVADVRIVRVEQCAGRLWYASPRRRTIYILARLDPAEAAAALADAVHALCLAGSQPARHLHLVPRTPDEDPPG